MRAHWPRKILTHWRNASELSEMNNFGVGYATICQLYAAAIKITLASSNKLEILKIETKNRLIGNRNR